VKFVAKKGRPHTPNLGFGIPDIWVVSYGLNYAAPFRALHRIAALKREVYESR